MATPLVENFSCRSLGVFWCQRPSDLSIWWSYLLSFLLLTRICVGIQTYLPFLASVTQKNAILRLLIQSCICMNLRVCMCISHSDEPEYSHCHHVSLYTCVYTLTARVLCSLRLALVMWTPKRDNKKVYESVVLRDREGGRHRDGGRDTQNNRTGGCLLQQVKI